MDGRREKKRQEAWCWDGWPPARLVSRGPTFISLWGPVSRRPWTWSRLVLLYKGATTARLVMCLQCLGLWDWESARWFVYPTSNSMAQPHKPPYTFSTPYDLGVVVSS